MMSVQILFPIAQRRQLDGEDVQAVVEVVAQLALGHRGDGIHVRGRQDADVDFLLDPAAQPPEFPLLQDAQQLDLRHRHHLGDLVEEQRAAIGELETAGAPIGGAGERAALVPEDLALEQRFRDRRAVDRDKRRVGARAELMDGLRDQLLASTRTPR